MRTTRKELWAAYHKLVGQLGNGQVFVCPVDEWKLGGEPIATTRTRRWLCDQAPWVEVGLFVNVPSPEWLEQQERTKATEDAIWRKVLRDAATPDEDENEFPNFE